MSNKEFKPYVPATEKPKEITVLSLVTGVILMFIFGAANAYLGLKVGMTVSASIPAAVVSMAILRGILKRGTILENNIVQTIGSTGESIAAGVVFSIPALFMVGYTPSLMLIAVLTVVGGMLGVVGMVIFRKYLIVDQRDVLPYPEGTACAEILIAGEEGGTSAKKVFQGGSIAAIFKFVQSGFLAFPEAIEFTIPKLQGMFGMNIMPSLVGVGYLIGTRISFVMLGGGILAWLVIIPLIEFLGGQFNSSIFPAPVPISELGSWGIWENYIQYIAAGTLTVGGFSELFRALPAIKDSFLSIGKGSIKRNGDSEEIPRTEQDISVKLIILVIVASFCILLFIPQFPTKILGSILTTLFALIFVSISSRIVGVVGSSSNPISGMTIATIFFTAIILQSLGFTGIEGIVGSIVVGSVVTIAAAAAGDMSQDLKTGYILGATPKYMQYMQMFATISFAGVVGIIVMLLHEVYSVGSAAMPAPATAVISILTEGIFSGNLPWELILIGVAIGIMLESLQIPTLPFAIGLYLPIHLTTPICIGGLIKYFAGKLKNFNDNYGTLFASGLVAGDSILGVIIALLTYVGLNESLGIMDGIFVGATANIIAVVALAFVSVLLFKSVIDNEEGGA